MFWNFLGYLVSENCTGIFDSTKCTNMCNMWLMYKLQMAKYKHNHLCMYVAVGWNTALNIATYEYKYRSLRLIDCRVIDMCTPPFRFWSPPFCYFPFTSGTFVDTRRSRPPTPLKTSPCCFKCENRLFKFFLFCVPWTNWAIFVKALFTTNSSPW